MGRKIDDRSFSITRLDLARDESWAVVGSPSGSIASNRDGSLMLRLSRKAAQEIADRLNVPPPASDGRGRDRSFPAMAK